MKMLNLLMTEKKKDRKGINKQKCITLENLSEMFILLLMFNSRFDFLGTRVTRFQNVTLHNLGSPKGSNIKDELC